MIRVSEPYIPDEIKYKEIISSIWKNKTFTNSGPVLTEFENKTKEYLKINNGFAVSNGTIGLELCLKALNLKGEVITPAFSWIATHSAIINSGCLPKYCDIESSTLNIKPESIESLISDKTVAILPVHVFGNPVDVDEVDKIARKYNLKVIYDAAHAFGSKYNQKSIFSFGDACSTSFHATKVVNCAEGGMVFSEDSQTASTLNKIRFYGFNSEKNIVLDGTNAKMSELNAALGLCCINEVDKILIKRKEVSEMYRSLVNQDSISFQKLTFGESNCSYFPIILEDQKTTLNMINFLQNKGIETRRYFYPSLSKLDIYPNNDSTPISDDISQRIICIPNHPKLNEEEITYISKTINSF